MTTTDFKRGDWILFKDKPTKVQTIDRLTLTVGLDINSVKTVRCKDIKPIILTRDILANNGWDCDGFVCTKGIVTIEFIPKNEGEVGIISHRDDVSCLGVVMYLHELQHFLWSLHLDDTFSI